MDYKQTADLFYTLLQTERKVVGIKFVYSKEEYDSFEAVEPKKKMNYCVAVKSACAGHCMKISKYKGGCPGSNRALGLIPCDPGFYTGDSYRLGLYNSRETASKVAHDIYICEANTYGLIIMPLEKFATDPDVILIVVNPREAMRVLQGYTYTYGISKGFCMSGNQAVCVESTVFPLKTKEMNVSMLCSGTRYHAKWNDNDVMCGIPWEKVDGLISGLLGTVNPIEMNDRKKEIETRLQELGENRIKVDYEKTYFKVWNESK